MGRAVFASRFRLETQWPFRGHLPHPNRRIKRKGYAWPELWAGVKLRLRDKVTDYIPVYVTLFVLFLIGLDVVEDARCGIWHKFEIGVIVVTLLALVWWWAVKNQIGG